MRIRPPLWTALVLFLLAWLLSGALALASAGAAEAPPGGVSQAEALRLGERIYREGILPSGEPVQAVVGGDLRVDGRMFSCASCHRRSGLGSVEGGVLVPPNTGNKLFQPSYYGRELTPAERASLSKHYQTPLRRPAYTEGTLARAIRNGLDPAGRELNAVMPRFTLSDADMAILVAYLKSLSAEPSPGVTESAIRFATVVTSEVPSGDQAAMVATLQAFVDQWNSGAPAHTSRAKYLEIAQDADLSYRRLEISRWLLRGPPATWRSQLEAYYAKEPVFALVGGISTGSWRPIHDFSEERRLPCIFPLTDLPVLSERDWYTLYFSRGLHQEGEAAATSLGRAPEIAPHDTVLQLYRDNSAGRALAAGFEQAWRSLGRIPPVTRALAVGEPVPEEVIRQLTGKGRPAALVLWFGDEAVSLLESLAAGESRPATVYLSASLLRHSLWTLPEQTREFVNLTYPYRLPQDEALHGGYARVWLRDRKLLIDDNRISTRMYALMLLLNDAIPRMQRNFYRDYLLDLIDTSAVHGFPDFERLSFGPGQRYASKGCSIVTLSRGPTPILIRKNF